MTENLLRDSQQMPDKTAGAYGVKTYRGVIGWLDEFMEVDPQAGKLLDGVSIFYNTSTGRCTMWDSEIFKDE